MWTVIIAIFENRNAVAQALDHLNGANITDVERATVVVKAESGETVVIDDRLHPDEAHKTGMRAGALMTALGIAQMGALALPGIGPVIVLGAGAIFGGLVGGATGRFASTLVNFGFRPEQIDALAEHLVKGEAALIIEIEKRDDLPQLRKELDRLGADIIETQQQKLSAANFKSLPPRSH